MTTLLPSLRKRLLFTSITTALVSVGCGSPGDLPDTASAALEAKSVPVLNTATGSIRTTTVPATQAYDDPTRLPLIQASDFTYLGAFATPEHSGFTGRAIGTVKDSTTGELRLFYRGHDQSSDQVAQISIPTSLSRSKKFDELPKSRFTQAWAGVAEGALNTHPTGIGDAGGNGAFVYGLLAHADRLVFSATTYYSYNQTASLGTTSQVLARSGDFRGFFALKGKVAIQRAMGGPMTSIPSEWQQALGGKALVGNAPVSVISANSFGPAMTAFDPDSLGSGDRGETLVFYPQSSPLCGRPGCESVLNSTYTWMSGYTGRAFPRGTRTILAIGSHPGGEMWYGGPVSANGTKAFCNDGGWGQKASAFESRVLAFDANDLLAVRRGAMKPWEVRPYANWRLPEIERSFCWDLVASTFDPESGKLFIVLRDASHIGKGSRIEVYRVAK